MSPMTELEYFEMQEDSAIGQAITECAKAIFDSHDAETMSQLQRTMYKYTDAGISISFELHDGSKIYSGDERAHSIKDPWNWVSAIGISSIVEGSDAEVGPEWIDLASDKFVTDPEGATLASREFDRVCEYINSEACALWDEANSESND